MRYYLFHLNIVKHDLLLYNACIHLRFSVPTEQIFLIHLPPTFSHISNPIVPPKRKAQLLEKY